MGPKKIDGGDGGSRLIKKKRNRRDPKAPKRSLSAYIFFAKDEREKILAIHPDLKANVSQVGKMIGEAWNKLTDDAKLPYEKKAAEDKIRYEQDKKIYLSTNKPQAPRKYVHTSHDMKQAI